MCRNVGQEGIPMSRRHTLAASRHNAPSNLRGRYAAKKIRGSTRNYTGILGVNAKSRFLAQNAIRTCTDNFSLAVVPVP